MANMRNHVKHVHFAVEVSLASQQNTAAMIDVAKRISQVDATTRQDFIDLIGKVASKPSAKVFRELFEEEDGEVPASLLDSSEMEGRRASLEPETSPVFPAADSPDRTALSPGETVTR